MLRCGRAVAEFLLHRRAAHLRGSQCIGSANRNFPLASWSTSALSHEPLGPAIRCPMGEAEVRPPRQRGPQAAAKARSSRSSPWYVRLDGPTLNTPPQPPPCESNPSRSSPRWLHGVGKVMAGPACSVGGLQPEGVLHGMCQSHPIEGLAIRRLPPRDARGVSTRPGCPTTEPDGEMTRFRQSDPAPTSNPSGPVWMAPLPPARHRPENAHAARLAWRIRRPDLPG